MTFVGLLLALASAIALNVGYYRQHGAAAAMPPLTIRAPARSLRLLFTSVPWLVGLFTGVAGWGLYVAALGVAPLSLVQAASAGGVGVLALLSWRGGRGKTRGEVLGVVLAVIGLVLLGLSLVGDHPTSHLPGFGPLEGWLAVSAALAATLLWWGLRRGHGGALGAAAGVLYAGGDTATKAVFPGGAHLVFAPAVLALHGLAFVALQLGFQRGRPLETAGTATLLTNALPILAGSVLYAESLGAGSGEVLRLLSFASVVAGALALALAQAPDSGAVPGTRPSEPAPYGPTGSPAGEKRALLTT